MIVALMLAALAAAPDPRGAFEDANARYLHGDFAGALRGYEALVADGFGGAALFYDIGNCHWQLGHAGWAIASWERAVRADPGDDDARANLEMALAAGPERREPDAPFLDRLLARLSLRALAASFAAIWAALWGLLALRRSARGAGRSAAAGGAVAAALLASGAGALLAAKARDERIPSAVVVAPASPVREGPSPALRAAFELREGATVKVVGSEGSFLRVRLPNGLEGWVPGDALVVL